MEIFEPNSPLIFHYGIKQPAPKPPCLVSPVEYNLGGAL